MEAKEKLYYLIDQQNSTYMEIFNMDGELIIKYNCSNGDDMKNSIEEFCKIFGGESYEFHMRKARNLGQDNTQKVKLAIPIFKEKIKVETTTSNEETLTQEDEIELRVMVKVKKQLEEERRLKDIVERETEVTDQLDKLDSSAYRVQYLLGKSILPLIEGFLKPVQSATLQGVGEDTTDEEIYRQSWEMLTSSVPAKKLHILATFIQKKPDVVDTLIGMIPPEELV